MIGLLFTGGDSPSSEIINEVIQSDWVRSFCSKRGIKPLLKIVAADSGAGSAIDAGFMPEILIGDMDSIDKTLFDQLKIKGIEINSFNEDKDLSDTQLGLKILLDAKCFPVILVGGGGGRLDHLAALLRGLEGDLSPHIWITDSSIIYRLNNQSLKKNADIATFLIKPKSEVSIFPLGEGKFNLKTQGLKWELQNYSLNQQFFSLSNRSDEGYFTFSAQLQLNQAVAIIALLSSELKRIN